MVPPIFIVLDAMPLTPNGKVDRRSLPAPDRNRPELGEEYVAPRNPTEAALAEIWSRVLEIERIGVNDDFFDLGGDSLMVIKVVSQANKAGLGVTTKQVFQNRTVAELAAVAGTSEILAEQGPVTGDTPCTPAQLHFLELGHPNPGWHSLGTLLELDTAVDVDAVEEAMRLLLVQHDNLRVRRGRARTAGRRWSPADAPPETGGVELHRIDLSGLDEAEQQVRIRDTVFDLTKSFDLAERPAVQGGVPRPGPGAGEAGLPDRPLLRRRRRLVAHAARRLRHLLPGPGGRQDAGAPAQDDGRQAVGRAAGRARRGARRSARSCRSG